MALVCDINYLPVATMRDRQKIFTKLRVTATPRPNQQRYGAKERHVDFYLQKDGIIHLPYAIGRALRPKQPLPDTPKIIASLKPDIDPWWPEQVEDMNLAMDFLRKKGSVLMHRPTASGKTRLACALICNLGRRAIVISKRQWQGQWIKTLNKITNLDVERVMSGRRFRRRAEVYVVSIGLLSRLKDMYDQFGTVIIDEVDAHCTATLRNILAAAATVRGRPDCDTEASRWHGWHDFVVAWTILCTSTVDEQADCDSRPYWRADRDLSQ